MSVWPRDFAAAMEQGFLTDLRSEPIERASLIGASFNPHRLPTPTRYGIQLPYRVARAPLERQASFVAGRLLAGIILGELGSETGEVPAGKAGEPIWPRGIAGSISHAGNRVVCFGGSGLVAAGIDIEYVPIGDALRAIATLASSATERHLLQAGSTAQDHAVAATIAFSAKETLFKALYPLVLTRFGFDVVRVCAPALPNRLTLLLTQSLSTELPEGRRFEIGYMVEASYVCTWLLLAPPNVDALQVAPPEPAVTAAG